MKTRKFLPAVISFLLSAALIFSALPMAFAASEYEETGATKLVFTSEGITAEKGDYTDYKIEGTALSIKGSGTYILSGECSNGSVTVKKSVTGVTLVLDGLTLTSEDTAPITFNKSSEVKIVAEQETENTLTDSAYNNDDNYPDNENAENAVIKCKDGSNVIICGQGTININARGKNGIKSGATAETEGTASLEIRDVTLNITADVNDGINAEATLNVKSGNITVSAADDGIHCDYTLNVGEDGTDGPTIKITKCYEGLEAADLTICSGDIEIHADDDGLNAANSDLTDYSFTMNLKGGKTVIYSTSGDGLDSNGTLTISGGTVIVWTASTADNQPLDADGKITINGGTVFAAGGSAGMGMNLTATQPCIIFGSQGNGGAPQGGGQPGGSTPPSAPDGQTGTDENTPPSAPNDQNDGSKPEMPSDNKQSGGAPGAGQNSFETVSAGSTITIKDSSGNTVYTCKAEYDVNSIVYSSSELKAESTYTLCVNDTEKSTATARTGDNIGQGGFNQNCSCLCHRNGILSIAWKIILVICKIFKINRTCRCGIAHY